MRKVSRWLVGFAALTLIASACGDDTPEPGSGDDVKTYDSIGEGEGQLKLIAWHGYTEDGTTEGYEEYDWVTPFEDETGCQVDVTYGDTSDEMVQLMRQGGGAEYDGVSASGDASNRLIAGGDVGAVDPSLFPEMENVIAPLNPDGGTNKDHYVVDGTTSSARPTCTGRTSSCTTPRRSVPAPTSWDVTFESDSPYAGKVTAYDSPIFIADAALYLMAHQPDLGITDPYALTQEQFDAAVDLLPQQQSDLISSYWALYVDEIDGFVDGSMVVGTAWPVNLTYTKGPEAANTAAVIPSEGVTGWADTWMISANAPQPELHAEVDGLDSPARRAGRGRDLLRRRRLQRGVLSGDRRHPRRRGRGPGRLGRVLLLRQRGVPGLDPPVEDAAGCLRRRPRQRVRRLLAVDAGLD